MSESNAQQSKSALIYSQEGFTAKYVFALLEDTYFGVLYSLHQVVNEQKLVRLNWLYFVFGSGLDFLHIIPFLVHGFGYGETSLAWARFARWIQLQIPLYTYADFQPAFWAAAIGMIFFFIALILFGVSYWYKYWGHKTFSEVMTFLTVTGLQVFYPALIYLLLTPWLCNASGTQIFPVMEPVNCWSMPNSLLIAFATFGLIILISVFFISSTIQSNPVPVPNDLTITTGPGVRNLYFFLVLLMTLNKFLISPSIGAAGFGNWWEALFNVVMTAILVWFIIYFLPYQSMISNRIRGGIFTTLFWIASCSFMYVNIPQTNPHQENFALDYIVIAGMLPFYLVGDFLVNIRISHMTAIAVELVEEYTVKKRIAAEKKEKESADATKVVEKKVVKVADKKKEEEKKDGASNLKSKMLRAAKGMGAKVNAMADVVNKTLDPNTKNAAAASADPNNEGEKKQVGETKEEMLARNPRLHLPGLLYHFQATSNTIDMVGRMLWHHTDKKEFLDTARDLYQKAEHAFPDRKYIKILRVTFLTATAVDPSAHLAKLDAIAKLEPSLATRYYIHRRKSEVKILASRVVSEDKTAVELVNYVEFQRYFAETQAYNNLAIQSIREFWMLFLQKSISFSAFSKATQFMQSECDKTLLVYKSMLVRYPRYSALLNSYAYFLELILHNAEEAAKYHRRADEQKLREVEEAKSNDGSGSIDTQCVIAITEDGQIEQVNKTLLKVFGYNRKEVMGRNIRMLVPSPWKEKHDAFLQRYRQTGVSKVIARPQTLYGQHKSGVSFQMKLTIQERRKENGERQYIGMISPITTENLNGVIIITEMGYIRLVTQRTLDLFGGYEASDLLTRNVNMLMIDSIAVAHDNHLKRYRDTGEARVIGTSGRNVPGRRKDNSVFPAALTVEELFLEGERSFMANIQDTSNTVGTIFMDGFGMIQNSDLGLQQLLGYRKEDIVGKNIKSIMPPPYSEYHDMYLERYRRTKVSNILRSTEGRILPAIHADGSAVSIRAIIARADTGDGTSGMLFKGIIKRGDLTSMSGKDFRKGYFENYEISLNKAGVIVRIKRQILTMLGHAADRPLSDFIGQPIEVLIPAMPDRPSQAKTNWMLRALKDPELNFYLLAVCKNFTLLPISFCLQASNEGDTIRMRIRDLSDADALMNIDEVGNVLSYNDDAYILLGHEPDDVIGRNIKLIQPPEVAANHDGYLKKYKNLKDKQAGVPRSVNGMHRDGNPIPIEIQITDMKGSEGQKGIIGRLRHRSLEDRVPRDLVLKYFTNTKHLGDLGADGASASVIASATSVTSGASRLRFKGKTASSNRSGIVGNSEKSQQSISKLSGGKSAAFADDTINYQMASHSDIGSESSGTGSRTSATTRNRIFDEKFKSIHNSEKDDPSLSRLGFILNIILGLYVVIFAIGLLLINLIPSPEPYYELLDLVTQYNVKLNEVIFASRFLALAKNESVNIGPCAFTNKTTLSVPVCEWVAAGIKYPHKTVPELEELWHESAEGFVDVVTLFEERYHKIRRPGDVLDKYIQGTFKMYQFVNGTPSTYTSFSLYTLWNVAGVFSDAANTLDANLDLSDKSTRAWNLVLANRLFMNDIIYDLVHLVPEVVKSSVENTVIYHLILAIISVVCGALGLFFAIIPQFRAVQQDREKILRLIVQLPKSVVYDLVYKVYATVDLEAEESQEEAAEIDFQLEQAKKEAADEDGDDEDGVEGGAGIDVQDISVIPDRSNKLYAAFAIGLFSISLPLIVHVAWRYAYDVELYKTVTLVTDFSILYTESISLSWRPMGFYLNCVDEKFCDKYPKNRDAFLKNVDHLREYYEEALSLSASIPSINAIFQNSITEPYKSPQNLLDRMAKSGDPFLPKGYADKTTLGMSTMINNILDSAGRLAARFDAQTMDDFWFLWEVLNNEGETGMYTLFEAGLEKFTMDLSSGTLAANATYAVGLVYAIAVFWFGFGAIRNYIRSETKASRNALYMVPIQVVRVTKPIIEYVEELHLSLTKG